MSDFTNQTMRTLLNGALRLVGIAVEGNPPSDEAMNNALYTANENIDSWNSNGLLIYTMEQVQFSLPTAKQVWTIGPVTPGYPTPDFIVPARPQELQSANLLLTTATPTLECPMQILSASEWADIRTKTIYTTIPDKIYMDQSYPIGNIYIWPIPSTGDPSLILWYWKQFSSAATLDTIIRFPPGYARLLRYTVAMNIAPEYNKPIPTDVAAVYAGIKRDLMVKNIRPTSLRYSSQAQGVGISGNYNILNDQVE